MNTDQQPAEMYDGSEQIEKYIRYLMAVPETIEVTAGFEGQGHQKAGTAVVVVDGEVLTPEISRKVWNHSSEFSWGFPGSGPAQLSLAILLQYLPVPLAVRFHQSFKFMVVANWPQEGYTGTVNLREALYHSVRNMVRQRELTAPDLYTLPTLEVPEEFKHFLSGIWKMEEKDFHVLPPEETNGTYKPFISREEGAQVRKEKRNELEKEGSYYAPFSENEVKAICTGMWQFAGDVIKLNLSPAATEDEFEKFVNEAIHLVRSRRVNREVNSVPPPAAVYTENVVWDIVNEVMYKKNQQFTDEAVRNWVREKLKRLKQ